MGRWKFRTMVGAGVLLALLLGGATARAQTWANPIPIAVTVGSKLWLDFGVSRCSTVPPGIEKCRTIHPKLRVECHGGEDRGVVGGVKFTGAGFHYVYCDGAAYANLQWIRVDENCPTCIYQPEGIQEHTLRGDPDFNCGANEYQEVWVELKGDRELMQSEVVNRRKCLTP